MRKTITHISIYFLSIFLLALVIQCMSMGVNNEILLPSIFQIVKTFFSLLGTSKTYVFIGNTLKDLLISLSISFVIGMVLGIFAGIFPYVRLFLKPWITILRSIPLASSLVIIMILAGLSKTPYYVCCFMLVPIFYEGFCQGIVNLESKYMDIWKLNSNISLKVIIKVHIPLILSFIKTSFIQAVGMGIKVIIMAEYLAGIKNTLGSAILPAANMLDYSSVYAYSILMIIIVLILEFLPNGIGKIYLWSKFYLHQRLNKAE